MLIIKMNRELLKYDGAEIRQKKVESIWVEIRNSKVKMTLIGVVYRPSKNIMWGKK